MITRNKCKRTKCKKDWYYCTLNKKGVCMARAADYSIGINLTKLVNKPFAELEKEINEAIGLID